MSDLEKARLACVRLDMACELLHQVHCAAVNPPRRVGGLVDHLPTEASESADLALSDAEWAAKQARGYLSHVLEHLELEAIEAAAKAARGMAQ